ncbi:MAG: hypothetical protein H7328_07715 [Bdellovibrio sp.]|nr:hypothetical protein [Bdellovibrio sp.]
MKALFILLFAFAASLTTYADETTLVVEPAAQLKVCAPRMAGCAHKIVIAGHEYLIDYNPGSNDDSGISNLMTGMIDACRAVKLLVSPTFTAEGFIVKEKGHFPNPTVEFEVFKLSYVANVIYPQ